MARDMSKDKNLFNCHEDHEINYVAGLYPDHQKVREFLKEKCASKEIYHSTHDKVYELIHKELGYPIPH
ncbi:hypothetical protein [Leptospira semungkisensis]|nr:hypothetical protein [Leptospira semungkisensis]